MRADHRSSQAHFFRCTRHQSCLKIGSRAALIIQSLNCSSCRQSPLERRYRFGCPSVALKKLRNSVSSWPKSITVWCRRPPPAAEPASSSDKHCVIVRLSRTTAEYFDNREITGFLRSRETFFSPRLFPGQDRCRVLAKKTNRAIWRYS